jgi:hypothetical protein
MRKLKEYYSIAQSLVRLSCENFDFASDPPLGEIFSAQPRTVCVLNHASPLSWIPAIGLLCKISCENGGAERVPWGTMHRMFYQWPLLREVATYLSQSDHSFSREELMQEFSRAENTDLVLFPEGTNCFFDRADKIQDFRSVRFIEIAVRTRSPILIVVHAGSENWSFPVEIGQKLLPLIAVLPPVIRDRALASRILAIPKIPGKIENFRMRCTLHLPQLEITEVAGAEGQSRISAEAQVIQEKMKSMLRDIQ